MRRPAFHIYPFSFALLTLSSLLPFVLVEGGPTLQEKWAIDGPCVKKWGDAIPTCPSEVTDTANIDDNDLGNNSAVIGEDDGSSLGALGVETKNDALLEVIDDVIAPETCSSPSSFQLTYTIHYHVKNVKYRIFQKDCKEEFVAGQSPLLHKGQAVDEEGKGPYYYARLSSNDASDASNRQTASIEFAPSELGEKHDSIEFCVRLGLWLPPEVGETEVTFRQTNVILTLGDDERSVRVVQSVELDPLPLVKVEINVFGSAATIPETSPDESEMKSEL